MGAVAGAAAARRSQSDDDVISGKVSIDLLKKVELLRSGRVYIDPDRLCSLEPACGDVMRRPHLPSDETKGALNGTKHVRIQTRRSRVLALTLRKGEETA